MAVLPEMFPFIASLSRTAPFVAASVRVGAKGQPTRKAWFEPAAGPVPGAENSLLRSPGICNLISGIFHGHENVEAFPAKTLINRRLGRIYRVRAALYPPKYLKAV
jgi:hypothetical protein